MIIKKLKEENKILKEEYTALREELNEVKSKAYELKKRRDNAVKYCENTLDRDEKTLLNILFGREFSNILANENNLNKKLHLENEKLKSNWNKLKEWFSNNTHDDDDIIKSYGKIILNLIEEIEEEE